jgi:hypothetical protein
MIEYYSQHVKDYKRRMRLRGEVVNKIEGHEYSNAENAAFELVNQLKPTHFVTLQLKQRRKIEAENGQSVWVKGDDTIYCKSYRSFIYSLSKLNHPKAYWQKYKPLMGNAAVIEGGAEGKRNHLHLILTKTNDWSELYFRQTIKMLAQKSGWLMGGDYGVNIQSIKTAKSKINSTFYSAKRGLDRILIA